jgi:hypothetical protein
MKTLFTLLLIFHGLIHALGFAKAFHFGTNNPLVKDISKPFGLLWLSTAMLFITVALLYSLKKDAWIWWSFGAIIISQILIFTAWNDAKFGTFANVIILIISILSWGSNHFENSYRNDVKNGLKRTNSLKPDLLTETDLKPLPEAVQRYLKYAGVLNKPKVKNAKIVLGGQMRDKGKDYFPFISEQYNFFDEPTRLFFMKAKMYGITIPGYHRFVGTSATMDIKPFGLVSIVKQAGDVMNVSETVTIFNDMCMMAPASLIDKRIQWQTIDDKTVKATFTNHHISIQATLYFNEKGQLINFISNDRTAMTDMKKHPFSTPCGSFKKINGLNLMTYGEAIYEYDDGKFTYGKFNVKEIEYNVSTQKF